MTTEVTQAEKREALARWEGWAYNSWSPNRDAQWWRTPDDILAYSLPDYFHDGNAMLRLLERMDGENEDLQEVYASALLRGLSDDLNVAWDGWDAMGVPWLLAHAGGELPHRVAEACWEAIQ